MSETLKLILSIWIIIIFIVTYIIYRINWANKFIDRIEEIVVYYRANLASEALYNLKKNNKKEEAIEIMAYLKTIDYKQMMTNLFGKNKFFKDSKALYTFKIVAKPWLGNINKSVSDKKLWIKMNDKLFGEGKWK